MELRATQVAGGYIDLDWDAVEGAVYDICSSDDPLGVKGGTNLTVTSSRRGPFADNRVLTYWINAKVITGTPKVSITAKLIANTTQPTPSPDTASIASVLNLAGVPGANHYYLGVGYPGGMQNISLARLMGGWRDSNYAAPTLAGLAVDLRVPVNGATTPNSHYPRVEFREVNADGSLAAWDVSQGTHLNSATSTVLHLPPNHPSIVLAQLHDDQSDTFQFRLDEGVLGVKVAGEWPSNDAGKLGSYTMGTPLVWDAHYDAGVLTFFLGGTQVFTTDAYKSMTGAKQYFKSGAYLQTGGSSQYTEPVGEYGEVTLGALFTSHA